MHNSAHSRARQSIDWVEAAGDVAAGGLAMVRRLAEAVGTLTVLVGVVIVTVPSVRESTQQWVRDLFTAESTATDSEAAAGAASVSAPDPRDDLAARAARLEPTDASVARYLARRYHVADEASMNPFAESPVGAQGLMQVMTNVHAGRFGPSADPHNALEPIANIRMG